MEPTMAYIDQYRLSRQLQTVKTVPVCPENCRHLQTVNTTADSYIPLHFRHVYSSLLSEMINTVLKGGANTMACLSVIYLFSIITICRTAPAIPVLLIIVIWMILSPQLIEVSTPFQVIQDMPRLIYLSPEGWVTLNSVESFRGMMCNIYVGFQKEQKI